MNRIVRMLRRESCRTPYWAWGMMVLFLLAGTVPYAAAWFAAPAGATATGVISNPFDTNSYLANMQQGYQGRWLYVLPYTALANRPIPLFSFYIASGHVARLTGFSLPLVFHLARLACGALFVLAAYHFIARYLERPGERQLALFILLFTGGTGWMVSLVPGLSEVTRTQLTPDLWLSDAISFQAMFANGHFTLNMVLMMGMIAAGEHLLAEKRWWWVPVAWLCGLGIALVHAHQLAVVGLVLAGEALWQAWFTRRIPWRAASRLALIFAPGGVLAGALTLRSHADPQLASWLAQGNTYTPPVWGMANLYGPVWVLAFAGAWHAARQHRAGSRGALLWFLTVLALIYLPVNFQRRFMEGWHVPVAILAATGWAHEIAPRLQRAMTARAARLVLIISLALVTASPAHTLSTVTRYVVQHPDDPLVYAHPAERGAVAWLREHATLNDVVLSYFYSGNWLPARAPVRSFLGHWSLTAEVTQRIGEVESFFDAATTDAERLDLLDTFGIDYVYVGPDERALGDFDPRHAPYLALVYDSPSVQLYRVVLSNP
ncbi:MAG: hypothetical protein Kow00106_04110 [Anaerolineae bacterium]